MGRKTIRMRGQYEPLVRSNSDVSIVTKVCSFCGEEQFIEAFAKNGVDAEGNIRYRDDCKTCYNIRRRENRTKKKHSDFIGGQKRRGEENPDFTHQEWKECLIFFAGECAYCGGTPRKGQRLTRDHLDPISGGGRTIQSNIVPACASCNSSKGAEDWREWFMKQSFFSQERMNRIFRWRTIMRQLEGSN